MNRYPTKAELRKIRTWPYTDMPGLFAYLRSLWTYADVGYWRETGRRPAEVDKWSHHSGDRYLFISTGGWSGNEDLWGALERNWMAMALCWVRSSRGGHNLMVIPAAFRKPLPGKVGGGQESSRIDT